MQNIFQNNIILIDGNAPITTKSYSELIRNIELLQKRAENEPNLGFKAILEKLHNSLSSRDKQLLILYVQEEQELAKSHHFKFRKAYNK